MFRIYTSLFILLGQAYLLRRVLQYGKSSKRFPAWGRKAVVSLFIFFNLPLVFFFFSIWKLTQSSPALIAFLTPFFIWHMATLFIFIILGIAAILKVPIKVLIKAVTLHPVIRQKVSIMQETPRFKEFDSSRRSFLQKGIIGLSAYSFIGATAGVIGEDECDIIRKTITIPGLPEEFKGFNIGMMSDIHSSVFMNKDDMAKYVAAMNSFKTDLIVVTGDMVNSHTDEVYPFAEAFAELKAPYGVFGCLGNHDYFTKNVELVAKEIDGCGVKLLRNDAVQIRKNGSLINLVGVDDIGRGTDPDDYLIRALAFAKNDQTKILLCHKPYYFENAKNLNIALTLSGHTHGGQIVFGTVDKTPISLAAFASKYVAGLYHLGTAQLYVNKGIGSVGVPFRINCPPELTILTLA